MVPVVHIREVVGGGEGQRHEQRERCPARDAATAVARDLPQRVEGRAELAAVAELLEVVLVHREATDEVRTV